MNLRDNHENLKAEEEKPKLVVNTNDKVTTFTGFVPQKNVSNTPQADKNAIDEFYDLIGLDKREWGLVQDSLTIKAWQTSKRTENGDRDMVWLKSYGGKLIKKNPDSLSENELRELLASIGNTPQPRPSKDSKYPVRFIAMGDNQWGKSDEYGGTHAAVERVEIILDKLTGIMEREPAGVIGFVDTGDLIEGINSAPAQRHTNDLSIPLQLQAGRQYLTKTLGVLRNYADHMHVINCTSNHAAWRDGSGYLGRPGDDYGIDIHRQVRDAFDLAGFDETQWHFPEPWREWTTADIGGVRTSATHGHRAKTGKVMDWWQNQTFAFPDQLTGTQLFFNGHWHTAQVESVGHRKWRIQTPSLDGGSAWFANMTGKTSLPGAITFRMSADGDLEDFRVIEVPYTITS